MFCRGTPQANKFTADYFRDVKILRTTTCTRTGRYTLSLRPSFPSQQKDFSLERLDQLLTQRKQALPENSYTSQLFKSAELRAEKLREETEELIEAEDFEHARWEAADLFYFMLVNALSKGVSLKDIETELRSRFND